MSPETYILNFASSAGSKKFFKFACPYTRLKRPYHWNNSESDEPIKTIFYLLPKFSSGHSTVVLVHFFLIKLEFGRLVFVGEGKPGNPEKNPPSKDDG